MNQVRRIEDFPLEEWEAAALHFRDRCVALPFLLAPGRQPPTYIFMCVYVYMCICVYVYINTAHPPTHARTHRHGHGCNNEALRILTGWVDEPLLNGLAVTPPATQAAALRAAKAHTRR